MSRTARIERTTGESAVVVEVDLDGTGTARVGTGVGFYDHMLTAFARHSLIDLVVESQGDTHVDAHHVVEDTAIVLGPGAARGARRQAGRLPVRRRHRPAGRVPGAGGGRRVRPSVLRAHR